MATDAAQPTTTPGSPGSPGSPGTPGSTDPGATTEAEGAVRAAAPVGSRDEPALQPGSGDGPRVDVAEVTRVLDGRHAEVRDLVRRNLAAHAGVLEEAETLSHADYRERVKDLVVELASTGQTGFGFPEQYGGGGDVGASVAAFETLAFGDLSVLVKVGVQFGLFGGALLQLGTERHHDAHLRDVVEGRLLGCFAMTETGHGSNVQALETVATYDAETQEFTITTPHEGARKDYIGNAALHAEMAVVFAQLDVGGERRGVHAFLVPIRRDGEVLPGVEVEDDGLKMGLNGVDNGRLAFHGVRVPREALLNQFADVSPEGVYTSAIENPNRRFFTMLGTLVQGRVSVGGAGINAAKVALTIATRYSVRRRQFEATGDDQEDLLLDYGLHQRRLFPLIARTYALHFAQDVLREQLHEIAHGGAEGPDGDVAKRDLESRAAGTKALGTWHATHTIQQCRELCGGAGYLAVNRFAALKADTDVFTTFEGDNHVLLQLVAKGLLTDYSSEFSDMDQFDMVRFVAGLAVETVIERTAVHTLLERVRDLLPGGEQWDQEAGLLDTEYQLAMLRFREEHMLSGVARRLKRGIDNGMEPGAVFSRVQDHVIAMARAHVERLVLEAFTDAVAALPDGDTKVALGLLCDLHALTTIEADRGWFLEHGRLSAQRSKAISREISDLCRRLRPIAVDLVDAFAVPEEVLRAPDLVGPVGTGAAAPSPAPVS
ncbi:acyl-CoA dehydrogenase [Nocardioides perillae]|uniref:acyl-CoA oxidase n=1 Tax=Nocardioides perillae TaxID=1119534 RepID=A0A7Y9RRX3_9ACTN|nr:acyl-CoA dehydrogenase [Nocardioides perillae]NYG53838.1 acyl-CoA oxidase [Nocardioides perillae]